MNRDVKSQFQFNFGVLQRKDPQIIEVLESANHVTGYRFDKNTATWHRKEVEGSLFIVKRKQAPFYQFLVMNRLNTENMVEEISADFQIQNTDPYMLYSNKNNEVNGIWFYNRADREKICNLIQKIVESIRQGNTELEQKSHTTTSATTSQNTMTNIQQPTQSPPVQLQSTQPPQQPNLSNFFTHNNNFVETGDSVQVQDLPQPPLLKPNLPAINYGLDRNTTPNNNNNNNNNDNPSNNGSFLDGTALLSPVQLKSILQATQSPQAQQTSKQNITKQQLQQWLIKLVQDDRFIDMVYNDYISR